MINKIKIKKIYWHNIYLNLVLEGNSNENFKFFVTDLNNEFSIGSANNNILTVNIVNIEKIKLLDNGKWYFFYYNEKGEKQFLTIQEECGYQLEATDKVFRYGAECYAYIINFQITELMSLIKRNQSCSFDYLAEQDDLILCMFTSYMKRNDHPDKKDVLLESKTIKQAIKKIMFIITKKVIQFIYQILSVLRRKDGHHILFMSETRVPISGNLKAIDSRMKERKLDKKFKISYSFSKTLQQSKFKTFFTWSRLLWLIAKQDYIFVDDYVPIFKTITLNSDTKLIQVWHAGVGFKSVGYSRFGKVGSPLPKDSCHRKYDYALVGSKGLIPVYEEVFGIDKSKFIASGLPRLDNYFDHEKIRRYKEKFYKDYPELKGRKIIMFAPTYRGNTQKDAYYPLDKINLESVSKLCYDDYAFIFKMHPFIKQKVQIPNSMQKYIKDLSEYGDINEMFYITDILITDFSSNIYEFALHKKPILFYAFDKDYYQLTRGVHRTLDDAPGTICQTFEEVLTTIKQQNFSYSKLEKFIEEAFDKHDKLSSDIAIDEILLNKRGELNE